MYKRNLDSWLCNLYIDVRKIDLVDFKVHYEKIELSIKDKTTN